jgi:hypothetical protein
MKKMPNGIIYLKIIPVNFSYLPSLKLRRVKEDFLNLS